MLINAVNLCLVLSSFFTKDFVLYEVWFYHLFHKRFGSFSQKAKKQDQVNNADSAIIFLINH